MYAYRLFGRNTGLEYTGDTVRGKRATIRLARLAARPDAENPDGYDWWVLHWTGSAYGEQVAGSDI